MKKYDTIFLDRDGTLNPDPGYINCLEDFSFFNYTIKALSELKEYGDRFCIITNQSGIGRGLIKIDELSKIHSYILNQFYKNNLPLVGIYFCPEHPDQATNNRKPGIGMFELAAKEHAINLNKCLMIGDAISDVKSGINSGMDTMLVLSGKGKVSKSLLGELSPSYIANNLLDATKQLMRY